MPNHRGFLTSRELGVPWYRVAWNYVIGGISRWMPPCRAKNLMLKHLLGVGFGPRMNAMINVDVFLDMWRPDLIFFGDGVFTGCGARFLSHRIVRREGRFKVQYGSIRLGEGAFVGGWSTVEGDVEIGDGASVASMALVPWGHTVGAGRSARASGVVARLLPV